MKKQRNCELILASLIGALFVVTEVSIPIIFLREFSAAHLPLLWFVLFLSIILFRLQIPFETRFIFRRFGNETTERNRGKKFFFSFLSCLFNAAQIMCSRPEVQSSLADNGKGKKKYIYFFFFASTIQLLCWIFFRYSYSPWVALVYVTIATIEIAALMQIDLEIATRCEEDQKENAVSKLLSRAMVALFFALFLVQIGLEQLPLINALGLGILPFFAKELPKPFEKTSSEERDDNIRDIGNERDQRIPIHGTPFFIHLFITKILLLFVVILFTNTLFASGYKWLGEEQFAQQLCYVIAVSSISTLVVSHFLYRFFLVTFTLENLLLVPLLATLLIIMSTVAVSSQGNNLSLFWFIAFGYIIYYSYFEFILSTVRNILLKVLAVEIYYPFIIGMKILFYPLLGGIAALVLLIFNNVFDFNYLHSLLIALIALVAAIYSLSVLYKEYSHVLDRFIQKRELSFTSFILDDLVVKQRVRSLISSSSGQDIIRAISLIVKREALHELVDERLFLLIEHKEAIVRKTIYHYLWKYPVPEAFNKLKERVELETFSTLHALLFAICACGGKKSVKILKKFTHSKWEKGRNVAFALLAIGDERWGTKYADSVMNITATSTKEERFTFLKILEIANTPLYEERFAPLLLDKDVTIRSKAIVLAGELKYLTIFPLLIENLKHTFYKKEAYFSLELAAESARPYLLAELKESGGSGEYIHKIFLLLTKVPNRDVILLISTHYAKMDLKVRLKLFRSLSVVNEYLTDFRDIFREEMMQQELSFSSKIKQLLYAFEGKSGYEPIQRALEERLEGSKNVLLYLLTILYPEQVARDTVEIFMHYPHFRGDLLEALRETLPTCERELFYAIFSADVSEQTTLYLKGIFDHEEESFEEVLRKCFHSDEPWWSEWIQLCTIYCSVNNDEYASVRGDGTSLQFPSLLFKTISRKVFTLEEEDQGLDYFSVTFMLKNTKLFFHVSEENIFNCIYPYERSELEANRYLFREGDFADSVYFLVKGSLSVVKGGQVVYQIEPGEVFGELAFVYFGGKRTASIYSNSDCKMIKISYENFYNLLDNNVEALFGLIEIVIEKLQGKVEKEESKKRGLSTFLQKNFDVVRSSKTIDEEGLISNSRLKSIGKILRGKEGEYFAKQLHFASQTENTYPLTNKMISIDDRVEIILATNVFCGRRREAFVSLAKGARELRLFKGETLVEEGDLGCTLYIICHGAVDVYKEGRKIVSLGEYQIVGEMSILTKEGRMATVVASEYTILLEVEKTLLKSLIDFHPGLVMQFVRLAIKRMRKKEKDA